MKLLVLNGPNLNLLGCREPEQYGTGSYEELCTLIRRHADALGAEVDIIQSNHEGVLIDTIQTARGVYDGIVLNPAAYTHTSIAIADALKAVRIPTVEVHISDVTKREAYRRISYVREACIATITGHGFRGYLEAMDLLLAAGRSR